jgi:hypothetical protein
MKEYIINGRIFRLNLFDKLNNESAYLIGYLAGDAAFSARTHKKLAKLTISSNNKNIILWIKENFCPDSIYRSIIPINKKRNIVSTNLSHILPLSSKFSPIFEKYGILDLKVNRRCVNISKALFRSYLKGLIDSDGHFSSGRRKDRNRVWCNFGITHQSIELLKTVQKYLSEEVGISSYINPRKDEKCMDLKLSKISDILILIKWLNEENLCPFDKQYQIQKIIHLTSV